MHIRILVKLNMADGQFNMQLDFAHAVLIGAGIIICIPFERPCETSGVYPRQPFKRSCP
jgi:uncharacterized membrane protein YccF (DUF307 family)